MEERGARWVATSLRRSPLYANQTTITKAWRLRDLQGPFNDDSPTLRSLIGVKNLRNADKARATDPWLWLKPTDFFRIVAAKQ
jgi:hypothetical protein